MNDFLISLLFFCLWFLVPLIPPVAIAATTVYVTNQYVKRDTSWAFLIASIASMLGALAWFSCVLLFLPHSTGPFSETLFLPLLISQSIVRGSYLWGPVWLVFILITHFIDKRRGNVATISVDSLPMAQDGYASR
ncbi:MAG: hypothetical protein SVY53_01155 [Chloroflexota bacterium]|nr:hypothetical protein [Chloroflexota bacterium]